MGVKNRDRGAPTRSRLERRHVNGMESVTIVDENTGWTEGMNGHGISIINVNSQPLEDLANSRFTTANVSGDPNSQQQ